MFKKANLHTILPLIFSAVGAVIGFATTFFVAKPLGAEIYGKVQYYVGVIQIFSTIAMFGLQGYIVKKTQFADSKEGFFTQCLVLSCMWMVVVFPIYFAVAFYLLAEFGKNIVLILVVGVVGIIYAVSLLVGSFFLGNFKAAFSSFFENLLPKLIIFICALILIFALGVIEDFPNIYIVMYGLTYLAVTSIFIFKLIKKTKVKFSKKEIIMILVFFGSSIVTSLYSSFAKVIGAEFYQDIGGVGVYSLCVQIASVGSIFSGVITSISRPTFSKLQDDKKELLLFFQKTTRINAYISIPFYAGFVVQAKTILTLFDSATSNYSSLYIILIIVSIQTAINILTGPNGTLLSMAGYEKIELVNGFFSLASFFVCAFAFKNLGIIGLPIATLVAIIISNIVKLVEITIALKKFPYDWKMAVHFIIMIVLSASLFWLVDLINNNYIVIALDIIIGISLIISFIAFPPFKNDKRFFFKEVAQD